MSAKQGELIKTLTLSGNMRQLYLYLHRQLIVLYAPTLNKKFLCPKKDKLCLCKANQMIYIFKYIRKDRNKVTNLVQNMTPKGKNFTNFENGQFISDLKATWKILGHVHIKR